MWRGDCIARANKVNARKKNGKWNELNWIQDCVYWIAFTGCCDYECLCVCACVCVAVWK